MATPWYMNGGLKIAVQLVGLLAAGYTAGQIMSYKIGAIEVKQEAMNASLNQVVLDVGTIKERLEGRIERADAEHRDFTKIDDELKRRLEAVERRRMGQ